jgi:hypothetical protein
MHATKRKALEAAGWRFGDAADFLEMTAEERQLLDARVGPETVSETVGRSNQDKPAAGCQDRARRRGRIT